MQNKTFRLFFNEYVTPHFYLGYSRFQHDKINSFWADHFSRPTFHSFQYDMFAYSDRISAKLFSCEGFFS